MSLLGLSLVGLDTEDLIVVGSRMMNESGAPGMLGFLDGKTCARLRKPHARIFFLYMFSLTGQELTVASRGTRKDLRGNTSCFFAQDIHYILETSFFTNVQLPDPIPDSIEVGMRIRRTISGRGFHSYGRPRGS